MLEFGFYEKEIPPPLGCGIPGYFNIRRGCDVLDRLYARAVVIKEGTEKIAILSVDGLHPKTDVCAYISKRIEEYTGIKRDNLMIAFTHTHTGIPFRFEGVAFEDDEIVKESVKGYIDVFSRLVADCVTLADLRLRKAMVCFGKGEVNAISFCRDYFMKNATPQTNPKRASPEIIKAVTESDKELPILFVKDENQNPLGAIVSFACHADCISGEKLSGDYISVLSKELKKVYGEEFVSVFLLGCSGDVNHFDVTKASDSPDHYIKMGKKLAGEVIKTVAFMNPLEKTGIKATLEYVEIPRRAVEKEKIEEAKNCIKTIKEKKDVKISADNTDPEQYRLAMAKRLIAFLESTPEIISAPLQCIQIGEFTIYGFNSEIFTEFGKIVKKVTERELILLQRYVTKLLDMFLPVICFMTRYMNHVPAQAGLMLRQGI